MQDHTDIHTFQYGGSGASYFHHQLLLTGDFHMSFRWGKDNEYARTHHFKKERKKSWKQEEYPHDNTKTLNFDSNLRKIFHTINSIEQWDTWPGQKVFLWTDLRTHLRMTWFKKAFWFYELPGHEWEIPKTYNGIKNLINSSPNNIFHHIEKNKIMEREDVYVVKFQDILTPEGLSNVFNDLGTKISQKNIDFMKHYIECHPDKLLDKCGIKKIT